MCRKFIHSISFVLLLGLVDNALAEIPRDPSLVIYYSYEDVGAIVPDESGRGHDGTVCGDVSAYPSGVKWYGAAKFEGIWGPTGYSYLDLDSPHYPAEDIPKSAITLAAWCKCQKTGEHHAIISCRASDNTWVIHPQINDNETFRWLLRAKGSSTIFNLNNVGSHGWDEWLHYAGTYDSVTGKGVLYINGEVCASIDVAPGQHIADWGTGARVGYNIDNARPFTGLMDELYLFTRALSQAEVKDLMASEALPSEKASHPKPGNGTELETTAADLLWLPGAYAVSNNVYFGDNFEDVNNGTGGTFKGNQTEAQFRVADLVWGTTYYWRIDGVNNSNPDSPWRGNVWSFLLRPPTAWNPYPSDGTKWVDTNVILSWSPGRGVFIHHVYFDDNFDDVNNATEDEAVPRIEATYDPGPLEFEKVYYWRVDEFDGSTTHRGNVWRFTTMRADSGIKGQYYTDTELTNLVLTRVDPGINFNWGSGAPDPTVGADNFSVRWTGELEVPFTSDWTFTTSCNDCVRLWVDNQLLFDKWGEQSGVEWTGTINLTEGKKYSIVMEYYENTGDAYAKLYWNSPSWLSPYQPKQIIPQGAFSLPLWAGSPNPANGATGVTDTPTLRWKAGEQAVRHQVFFGTDRDAVANADTITVGIYRGTKTLENTSYVPTEVPLEWEKTYYWKVNEVNGVDLWEGSVWSFTVANFVIIDDFEDYNDYCNRIFYIWGDGWGHKGDASCGVPPYSGDGTGSTVGYLAEPYAEQTITHDRSFQSMPMEYLNDGSDGRALYSETARTFDPVQDWTIHGVRALTLWFRGLSPSVGSFSYDPITGIYTITANGEDIFGTSDEFHYAYKQLSGVGSIEARMLSITQTDTWSKGGVMIRETLDANSPFAAVYVTGTQGCRFQARFTKGGDAVSDSDVTELAHIRAPHWVKLERLAGGTLNAYDSNDPAVEGWHPLAWNPQTINMALNVYIGLALTSHNTDPTVVCTAELSNVAMTGSVTGQWQSQDIGIASNETEGLYVALEDSSGRVKEVAHPDPNAVLSNTWQEWNIALADFAPVDATKVEKIYVGVGNRNTPELGGKGMLYIDDIRLYQPRCVPSLLKLDADFSGNCMVDYPDLEIMANEWLVEANDLQADLNQDDEVDFKDYAKLADTWLDELSWP